MCIALDDPLFDDLQRRGVPLGNELLAELNHLQYQPRSWFMAVDEHGRPLQDSEGRFCIVDRQASDGSGMLGARVPYTDQGDDPEARKVPANAYEEEETVAENTSEETSPEEVIEEEEQGFEPYGSPEGYGGLEGQEGPEGSEQAYDSDDSRRRRRVRQS